MTTEITNNVDNSIDSVESVDHSQHLAREIIFLENLLIDKKQQYFNNRLKQITGPFHNIDPKSIVIGTNFYEQIIQSDKITFQPDDWTISYTHTTTNYSQELYKFDNIGQIGKSTPYTPHTTHIIFGKKVNLFIKDNQNIKNQKYTLYVNSENKLRIINNDEKDNYAASKHMSYLVKQSNNHDIPEWFALKIFMHLYNNNWDDASFKIYLSIIENI